MWAKHKFQLTAAGLVVTLITSVYLWNTVETPPHATLPTPKTLTPKTALESTPEFPTTTTPQAAVLDPDTLRQRVVGPWLGTGNPDRAGELSSALDHHLADAQSLLELLAKAQDKTTKQSIPHLLQQLVAKQAQFLTLREETERWLADRNMQNTGQASQIAQRFAQLQSVLAAVNDTVTNTTNTTNTHQQVEAIADAQQTLQRLRPPRLGVRGEPQPTVTQGTPTTLTPADFPDAPPPAYALSQKTAQKTTPAHKPGDSSIDNLLKDNLLNAFGITSAHAATDSAPIGVARGAASCGFTPADVGSALPEVDTANPEIQALAEQLQHSPLKIYAWITNNIAFQPYYGSLKGALATLKSGAGNDTDQASLLIALMRVSGFPARYVTGEIQFDASDSRYPAWLGVKSVQAASNRLTLGQVPATYNTVFMHVWAEVCVPYDNYRGSGRDSASNNISSNNISSNNSLNSAFHWIPLDPSFKEVTTTDGTTVADIPGFSFDYSDYLSTRSHIMPQEALRDQMEAARGKPLEFGGGYRSIIQQQDIDILPSTLPYDVKNYKAWPGSASSETAALPAAHRIQAEFVLKDVANAPLVPTLTLDMPTLATRRLTLSFKGVTTADQNWINNTWDGEAKPCGVSNVQAVFKLEGGNVTPPGSPKAVDFCTGKNRLDIRIKRNGQVYNSVSYRNIGGHNYHALQAYAFQASDALVEARAARLLATVGATPDANALQDETLGEYLHIVGLKYMGYITRAYKTVGQLYGETGDSGNHIGLTTTAMKVSYLFDLPFAVSRGGLLIDVPGGLSRSTSVTDGSQNFAAFLLGGYAASAYEAYIWQEHALLDAVSTVRGIQFANDQGIPVVTLSNAAAVDSQLNVSCATTPENLNYSALLKTALKNLFAGGFSRITLPGCLIHYDNWRGAVWVAEKNTGGFFAASYTIAGAYVAGGGYALGYDPFPSFYSNTAGLNTGYQNQMTAYTFDALYRDFTLVTPGDTTYSFINPGNGSGVGETADTTQSGDPVNLVSGNMYTRERDISLKGRGGLNIVFERFYNSLMRKDGPLGYGWTHSFNHYLTFFDDNNNGAGDGKTNRVVWLDGTASSNRFSVTGTTNGIPLNTAFNNPKGVYVTARREANGEYSIREKGGLTLYFENVSGKASPSDNPTGGTRARLLRLVDRNGNSLKMHYGDNNSGTNLTAVQDDLNRRLTFYYDNGDQQITRITDWSGRTYQYTYSNNNLVRFDSPLAVEGQINATTYDYYSATDGTNLAHAMQSFTRPTGYSMTFEYYTNGKTFRHTDSLGQSYTFRYNAFRRETTTVDERGISQTYRFNEWGQQLQHQRGDDSRARYAYSNSAHPLKETRRTHALGYVTTNTYDAAGNLSKTTLPDGSTQEYRGYTAYGRPTWFKNANGNITLHRFDSNGNRTDTITLKKGRTVAIPATPVTTPAALPPSGDILVWTINTYNSNGNLKTAKQVRDFITKAGPTIEYTYDGTGLNPVTIKRCGLQHNTAVSLDGTLSQRCVSVTQAFDALGRPTKMATRNLYTQQRQYDSHGRITRATDATNRWRDYSYTANGQLAGHSLTGIDAQGTVTLLEHSSTAFDALDRPISRFDSAGFGTHTQYDPIGNVTAITNPDGYTVRFEYDAMNRPTRAFDAQGHAVSSAYDIGGRPITVTDPNDNTTTYTYYGATENGRLKRLTQPNGQWQDYFYDRNGNVIRTRDNAGRETRTDYDALNRPFRSVGPVHSSYVSSSVQSNLRQVTKTTYSNLGFVKNIQAGYTADTTGNPGSDTLSTQASYAYDDLGRPTSDTDANGKTTQFIYDQYGNTVRKVSPNGHLIDWTYDHARNGLLKKQTAKTSATDSSPHITTYAYSVLGQISKVTAPEVTYTYGYDKANRLSTVTDSRGNKTLKYTYSPGGQLTAIADSDNNGNSTTTDRRSDFLYDAARRLTAITTPPTAGTTTATGQSEQINFLFDAGGRLKETNQPNGHSARYQYDSNNNLKQLINRTRQGIISQHDYTYDAVGRRSTHTETIAGTTGSSTTNHGYRYDNLNRLTQVLNGSTPVETSTYDQYNNRRTQTRNGGTAGSTTTYYQHDAAQQLNNILSGSDTGSEIARFQYDNNGNLIYKSQTTSGSTITRTYTYNALEQLSQVQGNNAGTLIPTETYRYDPQGRRIEKTVASTSTRYHYSGQSLWAEYQSWNQALAYYTYSGLDRPIVRSTPNAADTRYYHSDGLGSIVATSNSAGATQSSTHYDAWGNVTAKTGSTGSGSTPQFGYTGREPDANGLIYYRARYYDPTIGRFTQRDPSGFADGINQYAYVGNSPTNFTDPLGLSRVNAAVMSVPQSSFPGARAVSAQGNVFTGGNASLSAAFDDCLSCHSAGSGFNGNFYPDGQQQAAAIGVAATSLTLGVGIVAEAALGATGAAIFMTLVTGEPVSLSAPTARYNRQQHYGGSQTNGPVGQAARQAGEGQPCPSCGQIQVSGTRTAPSPQHNPTLVEHYYGRGGYAMTDAQRREYARTVGIDGTTCLTCQRSEGASASRYSRQQAELNGL